ncbi:agmatinase family protein [Novosphingobium album (ex Liu et al. 2023)]|uniref:Agmatinase family protein n=1 Tax=Novosphingobium album (ex Liu et al. 2023) TaxID=3031130 RepID=A0ABT5WUN3_9SPHN|nr:agmatinase family protein [Novosphingobium album (ex Liu et al. 2023)]MDE8653584.1 agmatinase family protein [Novosphingobium album (ex Liu et al. 2023)]
MAHKTIVVRIAGLCLLAAAPSGAAIAQGADPIAALPADKKAFLADKDLLAHFGLTLEKVRIALQARSPEDAAAYVDGLMAMVADAKYQPGRDPSEIALNPQARGWNSGTVVRPAFLDKLKRDPGPFSLKRYMFRKSGIPTFADAPVAIRKEDLVAGKVEVAFVGAPLDFSSGWRDAKHAPEALRGMDGLIGADADGGVDPGLVLSIADYGDLTIDSMAPDRGLDHVREMVAEMASVGVKPFIVGGDHTLMYPDVAAMVDNYGAGNVAVVQFDAHADAEVNSDHFLSDNQTLSRLMQDKVLRGSDVIHVGMRGREADSATQARLKTAGVRILPTSAIAERGWQAVTDDIVAGLAKGPRNVFVSFDMSVLDPGDAPASGRPVPGGIAMREAIPMIRQICSKTNVVGFDLLDTAPILDPTYVTRMSANYILHACLSGIAMRKVASKTD